MRSIENFSLKDKDNANRKDHENLIRCHSLQASFGFRFALQTISSLGRCQVQQREGGGVWEGHLPVPAGGRL